MGSGFFGMLKNLLIFPLLGMWFVLVESYSYYLIRKKSDIYNLETINLAQNGFWVIFNNSSVQKEILNKDILKLSFAGYNPYNFLAKTNIWYLHYVVEYVNLEGEKKELLIPLDMTSLPDFLESIIKKAGLIKVRPSQFSLLYEWRKPCIGENLVADGGNDLNPLVIDPNRGLLGNDQEKQGQRFSFSFVVLVFIIIAIFLYMYIGMMKVNF